jgi:hypothetical protein
LALSALSLSRLDSPYSLEAWQLARIGIQAIMRGVVGCPDGYFYMHARELSFYWRLRLSEKQTFDSLNTSARELWLSRPLSIYISKEIFSKTEAAAPRAVQICVIVEAGGWTELLLLLLPPPRLLL